MKRVGRTDVKSSQWKRKQDDEERRQTPDPWIWGEGLSIRFLQERAGKANWYIARKKRTDEWEKRVILGGEMPS